MEQSKPEGLTGPIPKPENGSSSNQPAIQPGETKSCSTKPAGAKLVDLTQGDSEDSAHVNSSETKQQSPPHGNAKVNKAMKRKTAPVTNNGQQQGISEPETKPAAKKRKPSTPKNDTKGSKAQAKKKSNGAAGKQGKDKAKPKSKNQLTMEGRDARRECKNLKSEIMAKNEEIHRLETITGNLHNQNFSLLRKRDASFMDDSLIQTRLFDLRESCAAWTVKYSIHGRLPDLDPLSMKELISFLTSPECTMSKQANFLAAGSLQYGSTIVLNALLAQFICFQIIQQPFFFIRDATNERLAGETKQFFDNLSNLPLSCAHDWVSQTLEMLVPSGFRDTNANNSWIWETILESRKRYYDNRTKEFTNGPAALLLSPQNEDGIIERRTSLRSILEEAGELSIELRKQRMGVRCLYIDSAKVIHNGFQSSSELMELHDCMCREKGTDTLNGKDIAMVIEPAIIAYWTDNDGIEKEKVWAKTVVWVDDWDKSKTGQGPMNGVSDQDPLTIDEVQTDLEKTSVASTIGTPNTCIKGDGKPNDETTNSVDTTGIQPTFTGNNNDNISNNTPETAPDSMDIVKDEYNGEPSVPGMGDNEISRSPSLSLLKPKINQSSTAEHTFGGPEPETESIGKPSLASLEKFPSTSSCEPNHSPSLIEDTTQTVTKDKEDLTLETEDELNDLYHSFSVVIDRSGGLRTPARMPTSGTSAETGADHRPTEIRTNEDGDAQYTIKETSLQETGPENEFVPLPKKEVSGDATEYFKIEPVSTVGDDFDRFGGGSLVSAICEDSPVKVEEVDDCTALKDSIPTTAALSDEADQDFGVVSSPDANYPTFIEGVYHAVEGVFSACGQFLSRRD